jgi:hypothetical protein
MDWSAPVMRCARGHVGKPKLEPGTSAHIWAATCRQCAAIIKTIPRLGVPVRLRPGEAGARR